MASLQDSQPIPRRLHQLTASLEHWYYSHHKPEVHRNHPNKYIIIYTMYICQTQAKLYVVNYYFLYNFVFYEFAYKEIIHKLGKTRFRGRPE